MTDSDKSTRKDPLAGIERLAMPNRKEGLGRRRLIRLGVLAAFVSGVARLGLGRAPSELWQGEEQENLSHLNPMHQQILRSVATVVAAGLSQQAVEQGWNVLPDVDAMVGRLDEATAEQALQGIVLFDQAHVSWDRFVRMDWPHQIVAFDDWRQHDNTTFMMVWSFLAVAAATSLAGNTQGWSAMSYEGPCVSSTGHQGRDPGQTVAFEWSDMVP